MKLYTRVLDPDPVFISDPDPILVRFGFGPGFLFCAGSGTDPDSQFL